MAFVKTGWISFKKSNKIKNRLLIGIDQGCTLTKIIFLNKENKDQLLEDSHKFVTLQWTLFINDDFEEALTFVQDHAYIPNDCKYPIHITGVGAYTKCELIEMKFGLKVEAISENMSISVGALLALSDIGAEKLTKSVIKSQTISKCYEYSIKKYFMWHHSKNSSIVKEETSHLFPCLVFNCGSASSFLYITEEGKSEEFGVLLLGGKTLLGLAKCLLDINGYQELTELATFGCREFVDSQVKDIFENYSSNIPNLFKDLPLFSFGKLDDINFNLEDGSREDIARSLVALYCTYVLTNCAQICNIKKLQKVYLNGNLFQSPIFAEELQNLVTMYSTKIELVILDCGYVGSLAAMLSNVD